MNKLNLLLLISLVFIAISCEKIELPEPKEEEPEFGLWSGQIGETPLSIENDSLFMDTKIIPDPVLNINTFQTSFTMLGSTQPQWIFKYRDSKTRRTAADTSDLFYISKPKYLKDSNTNKSGYLMTHSLKEIEYGNEVIWMHSNSDTTIVEGGRHFSVEIGGPNNNPINIKAEIISNGHSNSVEKNYLSHRKIDLEDIIINGNKIAFDIDPASKGSSSVKYRRGGSSISQASNEFLIDSSGNYSFEIYDLNRETQLLVKLYLELSNGVVKLPKVPLFRSSDVISYPKLPNFSTMEIIYFDKDGIEYSTRHVDQGKPFIIKAIETFEKTNQQGQKVKKLDIEFSVQLKAANGNIISFTGVKGDIGFAYD